jgi:hypothetical protein
MNKDHFLNKYRPANEIVNVIGYTDLVDIPSSQK